MNRHVWVYIFLFTLTSLAAYRLQRIVTADTWYPSERFRQFLTNRRKTHEERASLSISIASRTEGQLASDHLSDGNRHLRFAKLWLELEELFTCPWCFGWWVSGLTVLAVDHFIGVPYPLIWWPAVSTVVGKLGSSD